MTRSVAYLVSQHPALSHAFITQEVQQLEARGWHVDRYSLRRSERSHLHLPSLTVEAAQTTVLQSSRLAAVGATAAAARSAPSAFAQMVRSTVLPLVTSRAAPLRRLPGDTVARLAYLAQAAVLARALARGRATHVHVHFANNAGEVARLACEYLTRAGRPTTYSLTLHSMAMHGLRHREDDDWPHHSERRWGPLATKLRDAAFTACISDFCRSRAEEVLDGTPASLHVVHMGVDVDRFCPATHETPPGPPLEEPVVLFVGRLAEEKGTAALMDAAETLLARGERLRLLVAGDGPLRPMLEQRLAESARLGAAVELLGPVSNDALPALYRRADVFCLPSTVEGVPVVLMEAMASGLPVVSTRTDGIPELVEDQAEGRLVDRGDVHGLVEALSELLGDPHLRAGMSTTARTRITEAFDSTKEVEVFEQLLRDQVATET